MKKLFLVLILMIFYSGSYSQVFTVDTIYYHGDTDNRINMVILGDGYLASELAQFRLDAQSVADYFFSIEPFSTYRNFFNFFAIEVVSNESGVNHPGTATDESGVTQPITVVDNYLQTTFDHGGTHRCVYSNQQSIVFTVANTNFPAYDFLNVIINTSYYGGCAGGVAYTTMNSSSPEVFVHEFGHMFGQLADEYEYGSTSCTPGVTQRVNVTQQTDTSLLIWKRWLTNAPIPTPAGTSCNLIGLYQGAQYCDSNWYRPKCDCKMRSLNQPYCEVCYEQFIYMISTKVNYFDSHLPANAAVNICQSSQKLFSVDVLNTTDSTIRVQWLVDNVPVSNNSFSYLFNAGLYPAGTHQVKAVAYDSTLKAKRPLNSYNQTWNVYVLDAVVTTTDSLQFCEPDSAILKSTRGVTYTYQWLRNNQVISGETDSTITVKISGNYSVVISNGICYDTSAQINVIANPLPAAQITLNGNDTICTGNSVLLSTNLCGTCNGQWKKDGINISGAVNDSLLANTAGSYTVDVMDTVSGCRSLSVQQNIFEDACLGIGNIESDNSINVYPNPTSGKIILENYSKGDNNLTILVFDMIGKFQRTILKNEILAGGKSREIDCSDLSPGIFILQITSGNRTYLNRLIIIK